MRPSVSVIVSALRGGARSMTQRSAAHDAEPVVHDAHEADRAEVL
jgi:hypothetical protein